MKFRRKALLIPVLFVPIMICTGCPGFKRPACKYEQKTVEAYISNFMAENDSVISISFKSISKQKSSVWSDPSGNRRSVTLNNYEIEHFGLDYSMVSDTTVRYAVNGSFIVQGTCSPSMISSVEIIE